MKRIIMLFNLLGIALLAFSQGEVAPDEKTFYGGVAYYYLNLNADLWLNRNSRWGKRNPSRKD